MELNRKNIKCLLLIICGGAAFYAALQHLSVVFSAWKWLIGILFPFLLGMALAFILNVPMRAIERGLFPHQKKADRIRRPLALLLTLLAVLSVLSIAAGVIAPGIRNAVLSIVEKAPGAFNRLEEWLRSLEAYLPQMESFIVDLDIDWQALSRKIVSLVQNWGSGLLSTGSGFIGNIVSAVSAFIIGLIFSFYILMQKEKLSRQGRQLLYALLPMRWADHILGILRLSNQTFTNFLSGQCLEACILGGMFVVTMKLFKMPYALLVGVLIALTALIPIVGAFIGCAVGTLLIAIDDPWKAVAFIVMFLILQQIEGNLIYPHVVGSSVGLPSIWVLAAVTLGGKLMGIVGMLAFIPLCSVLYAMLRGFVQERLQQRKIPEEKWQEPPKSIK